LLYVIYYLIESKLSLFVSYLLPMTVILTGWHAAVLIMYAHDKNSV